MSWDRSHHLINALVANIHAHEGRRVAGKEIADYLRVRPATLSKWLNARTRLEQVEWLLRLVERLPEDRWVKEFKDALMRGKPRSRTPAKRRIRITKR